MLLGSLWKPHQHLDSFTQAHAFAYGVGRNQNPIGHQFLLSFCFLGLLSCDTW